MLNNLRELRHKREESKDAAESLEEEELAISWTGFSFFIGKPPQSVELGHLR